MRVCKRNTGNPYVNQDMTNQVQKNANKGGELYV